MYAAAFLERHRSCELFGSQGIMMQVISHHTPERKQGNSHQKLDSPPMTRWTGSMMQLASRPLDMILERLLPHPRTRDCSWLTDTQSGTVNRDLSTLIEWIYDNWHQFVQAGGYVVSFSIWDVLVVVFDSSLTTNCLVSSLWGLRHGTMSSELTWLM